MLDRETLFMLYFVLSMVVIIFLSCRMYNETNKEKFCACGGMGNRYCPNKEQLKQLYNSGELTEYTKLEKKGFPDAVTKWNEFRQYDSKEQAEKSCK